MDIAKIKKAYFIGIKGVGMTMLAEFLAGLGVTIEGSDVSDVYMTDRVLSKIGANVHVGFEASRISREADLIVYSTAYDDSNPEVSAAKASGILTLSYAEALGKVFNYRYGIAVCGSHGKTTVTAWLGFVLNRVGLKPSVMVGSQVPQFGGSGLFGSSDYLIIEADEYQNKLQYFEPKAVLLNNIDYDHPDFFPDVASYDQAFADFLAKIPSKGWLVANFDDPTVRRLASMAKCRVISYGLHHGEAELLADNLAVQAGEQYFRVRLNGDDLGTFHCRLIGEHNVSNALAVIAASLEMGVDLLALREALAEFIGTARRMEKLGVYRGAILYDDYAHHPTEVAASLKALRSLYPDKVISIIFHPHTFTRTKVLLKNFALSLAQADRLALVEIYGSAREERGGISSRDLIAAIGCLKNGQEPTYLADLTATEEYIRRTAASDQVIALIGAGDIFRVAENILKQ